MPAILIIEDDPVFARRLARNLGLDGYMAEVADGPATGLEMLARKNYDAVLCDIRMPGMDGLDLLSRIRGGEEPEVEPDLPIVMLTSVTSVETAVDAMRRGASDYLTKDAGRPEIVVRLDRALGARRMAEENRRLRETVERTGEFGELVGESPEILRIKEDIREVAPTTASVLITGETGVGKELVARAIHKASGRTGEFVDINGAMLPDDTMLQSELFGHERGAFTDAKTMRKGKLELADGGTLFIDEVGDVSREVQAKLLRVLETMSFTRVGGTKPIAADVRIVAATNSDLGGDVKAGRFRDDLYYRLNVFPLEVPPLRRRRGDIAALARFFLGNAAARSGRSVPEPDDEAMALLHDYNWPGNIRELRNICERLVIRARGGSLLTASDVRTCGVGETAGVEQVLDFPEEGVDLDDLERKLVVEALRRSNWRQTEAARLLGISTDRMNNRVRKFGITHRKWRVHK